MLCPLFTINNLSFLEPWVATLSNMLIGLVSSTLCEKFLEKWARLSTSFYKAWWIYLSLCKSVVEWLMKLKEENFALFFSFSFCKRPKG